MELENIEQLLSQVKTISSSYERLNEANGGNFNIFSVLRIESDEVTTHSRFIAELLNPNGVHGFENKFLKLFIDVLNIEGLKEIDTAKCQVSVEAHQGRVTDMPEPRGGSIDILVKEPSSDEHVIMIENKIYAGEQKHQLLRYHNAYPKGKLLFLTLDGHDSEQESSKKTDYIPISYENHIISWLEECRKVAVSNPTLRETLTQYINLIKKLTNQNINSAMNKELVKLFTDSADNYDCFISVSNLRNDLKKFAIEEKIIPAFEELKKEIEGFNFNIKLSSNINKYTNLCWVENKKLEEKGLKILFQFQQKNMNGLIGGFVHFNYEQKTNHDYVKLQENFRESFKSIPTRISDAWPSYFEYWYFMNLENNLLDLKNMLFGNFKNDLKDKVNKMIVILDDCF